MTETRNCMNCKVTFQIFPEDFSFYQKIKAPPPTWCPECRNMRRCAQRNERVLYMRACDLCKKQTLSTYHTDVSFPVYCPSCWWSDNWDAMSFGRDFDFSRSFFEQFNELSLAVPHVALNVSEMENSDYCQYAIGLKDSYLAICSYFGQGLLYTYWIGWSEDLVDSNFVLHSKLCYESQDVQKSYGCRYVYNSQNMTDSEYCFTCSDLNNCFMCVNLRHKSYCIKNTQYTKEEYEREMQKYDRGSYRSSEDIKKEFWNFVVSHPLKYAFVYKSENCLGDFIRDCKDVYWGFDVFGNERGRYVYDSGGPSKDCMDFLQFGIDCELGYEGHDGGWSYNAHFVNSVGYLTDCKYVMSSRNCQDCFGCFGLQKKQYCILNTQYAKDDYEKLKSQIIEHMRTTGEYGEFFPIHHSPYGYNETVAQQWYPKKHGEMLVNGWKWQENLPGKYNSPTIDWKDVPDNIRDVPEDTIKNIFACLKCSKNYKIIKTEFAFYKVRTIPLPRLCPDCRFAERIAHRNPRTLYHRTCMKSGCANEFETTYAPDRPETVYCGSCYQAEVI
ncbi:hypothetical protein HY620_03055 [Candidatus Uhrbacteria bacterium]|nr:hypothetical protein [Candidatus Uhrbacteria bacterium]